jgi:hypothetical protein
MAPSNPVFLDFVRVVVGGDIDEVSRRLALDPALAAAASEVGATRQESSTFFFAEIAHYLYAGDTALHMAAAAFRRPVAEILVATELIAGREIGEGRSRFTTRRTRTDGTRRPRPRRSSTSYPSAPIRMPWTAPAWRRCTEPCARARSRQSVRSSTAGPTPRCPTKGVRHPCSWPVEPPGEEGAVRRVRGNNRPPSSGCCWSEAREFRRARIRVRHVRGFGASTAESGRRRRVPARAPRDLT